MNDHDAASIAGEMAGLGSNPPQSPVTPTDLIRRFCSYGRPQPPQAQTPPGSAVHGGFCGYSGEYSGSDPLITGFDEGHSLLGYLGVRGWRALPEHGDWPYVIYMQYPATDGNAAAVLEYCEGDLTIWQFATAATAAAFCRALPTT